MRKMMKGITTVLFMLLMLAGKAQDSAYQQYIATYAPLAIAEQQRTGVPASIKLAQGLLESGAGKGDLVNRSNNHFGIKCKATWTGDKVYHDDDARGECFRAYASAEESYRDHSNFLKANGRYAALFTLDVNDYKGWAEGLKKAGYATNPRYVAQLIKVIEENNLQSITAMALHNNTPAPATPAVTTPASEAKEQSQPTVAEQVVTPAPVVAKPAAIEVNNEPATAKSTAAVATKTAYPSGYFYINETKVMWAEAGSSLLAIAANNQLALADLLQFNDMPRTDILPQAQLLFVERKKKKSDKPFVTSHEGKTLWQISQTEGIRLAQLQEWNKLNANEPLAAGTKVLLQPATNSTVRSK